jgi:hypothetical protein
LRPEIRSVQGTSPRPDSAHKYRYAHFRFALRSIQEHESSSPTRKNFQRISCVCHRSPRFVCRATKPPAERLASRNFMQNQSPHFFIRNVCKLQKTKDRPNSNRNKNGCFSPAQFSASRWAVCAGNAPFRTSIKAFPTTHERNTRAPNSTGVPSNPTAPFLDGGPSCVTAVSFPSL